MILWLSGCFSDYTRELGDYEMGSIITDWLLWNNAIVDRVPTWLSEAVNKGTVGK